MTRENRERDEGVELLDREGHDLVELESSLQHVAAATLGFGGLAALERTLGLPSSPRPTILDVGAGNGQVVRRLAGRWAARGTEPRVVGVDHHPQVAPLALAAATS